MDHSALKTNVIFVGGFGRSGSTLLEMILNEAPTGISVGELCWIWDRGLQNNQLCGCGKSFNQCEFWNEVFHSAFGSEKVPVDAILKMRKRLDRLHRIPLLLTHINWPEFKAIKQQYSDILGVLIKGIQSVSGASFVVDSSKRPSHGFLLAANQSLSVNMIHLVRDSRAVCYSWRRKRIRPEIIDKTRLQGRFNIFTAVMLWNMRNYSAEILRSRCQRSMLVRYEDFAMHPQRMARQILDRFDLKNKSFEFVKYGNMTFGENHTISGNPIRFERELTTRLDNVWRDQLPAIARFIITFLSYPLLRRYGYLPNPASHQLSKDGA